MHSIRTVRAAAAARLSASFGSAPNLQSLPIRLATAGLAFLLVIAIGQQSTQAGPTYTPPVQMSLLPESIGIGVSTADAIRIAFDEPMDRASVEAATALLPEQSATLEWNADSTELKIVPEPRWQPDESYVVVVGAGAARADGRLLDGAQRYSFSTQRAPTISGFEVDLALGDIPNADSVVTARGVPVSDVEADAPSAASVHPARTATEVSATGAIFVKFSEPMDRADVERRFAITPDVPGELSWTGAGALVFRPTAPLSPGARHTISLVGAHDAAGNVLDGKTSISFVVRAEPQLVRLDPAPGAADVEPAMVEMWFSQPMNVDATNEAFELRNTTTGALVAGYLEWNDEGTQLVYTPAQPFTTGRTFEVTLGEGSQDANGHPFTASWSFSTAGTPPEPVVARQPATPSNRGAAAVAPAPAAPAPPPPPAPAVGAGGLEGHAMAQINGARAAYGLPPLAYDPAISAVAAAHAMDQINRGYYSHYTLGTGATVQMRLAAGGISFSAAGENQCYRVGSSPQATMDWCHGVFMSEPWPGYWNHIGNILSSRYTRVGIGVATNGSRVVITWNFSN